MNLLVTSDYAYVGKKVVLEVFVTEVAHSMQKVNPVNMD